MHAKITHSNAPLHLPLPPTSLPPFAAAVCQLDLLAELNESGEWRREFTLFCAAYLGVEAADAFVLSADRLGFSVLGRVAGDSGGGEGGGTAGSGAGVGEGREGRWRLFRFAFEREVSGREAFMHILDEMRREVVTAAGGGPAPT
jgi:hypothetical protein